MNNKLLNGLIILILLITVSSNLTEASPKFTLIYVVQEGDTLFDIAMDYGISMDSLLQANNLSPNKWIKLGQELIIPQKKVKEENQNNKWDYNFNLVDIPVSGEVDLDVGSNYSVRVNPKQPLPEVNIPKSQLITYHIGVGDTLFDLARSFNTSIGVIMALNKMDRSIIRVGQKILLPINNLTPKQILARTISKKELELLARVIHGEARGEPFIGQVAVGAVVINRVVSDYFPDTFEKVVYQKNQFSAVGDGQIHLRPNSSAYRAAREALKGTDPTMGALYYYNPKTAKHQWWFATRRMMVTIGDHVFAK